MDATSVISIQTEIDWPATDLVDLSERQAGVRPAGPPEELITAAYRLRRGWLVLLLSVHRRACATTALHCHH